MIRKISIVIFGVLKVICLLTIMASALSMFVSGGNGNEVRLFIVFGTIFIGLAFLEKLF